MISWAVFKTDRRHASGRQRGAFCSSIERSMGCAKEFAHHRQGHRLCAPQVADRDRMVTFPRVALSKQRYSIKFGDNKMPQALSKNLRIFLAAAAAFTALPLTAQEQGPSRTITMIVPLSAGSAFDVLGRALAEGISKAAGQPVVVLNRDGAAMTLGMDQLAKAKPDGYTIAFSSDIAVNMTPLVMRSVSYKESDFEVVCRTNVLDPIVVTGPNSSIKSFEDLIAAGQREPGKLTYGTSGIGQPGHVLVEAISQQTGAKFAHVPFRNIGELSIQTLNGGVAFSVTAPGILATFVPKGMRGLATWAPVSASNNGLPAMPRIKDLLGERAPSAAFQPGSLGVFVPKGLDPNMRAWLRSTCKTASEAPGFIAASKAVFARQAYLDGPAFQTAMNESGKIAADLIPRLNIKPE